MKLSPIIALLFFFSNVACAQQKADDSLLLEYYRNQCFADAQDYLKKILPEPKAEPSVKQKATANTLKRDNKLSH